MLALLLCITDRLIDQNSQVSCTSILKLMVHFSVDIHVTYMSGHLSRWHQFVAGCDDYFGMYTLKYKAIY